MIENQERPEHLKKYYKEGINWEDDIPREVLFLENPAVENEVQKKWAIYKLSLENASTPYIVQICESEEQALNKVKYFPEGIYEIKKVLIVKGTTECI